MGFVSGFCWGVTATLIVDVVFIAYGLVKVSGKGKDKESEGKK